MAAALSLLFVLHSAVLKPDLHLFFGQVQVCGDLDAPQSGEVHVRGELSLQLQKLRTGEGCAHAFAALKFAVAVFCKNKRVNKSDCQLLLIFWREKRRRRLVRAIKRAIQTLLTD